MSHHGQDDDWYVIVPVITTDKSQYPDCMVRIGDVLYNPAHWKEVEYNSNLSPSEYWINTYCYIALKPLTDLADSWLVDGADYNKREYTEFEIGGTAKKRVLN